MRLRCRNLASATTIWLTAFLTLFATSPRWECVCPDGSRNPLCLSFVFGPRHCTSQATVPAAKAVCCCAKPKPAVAVDEEHLRNAPGQAKISAPDCGKEFSQTLAYDEDSAVRLPPGEAGIAAVAVASDHVAFVRSHISHVELPPKFAGPPIDFIILLQHFRI